MSNNPQDIIAIVKDLQDLHAAHQRERTEWPKYLSREAEHQHYAGLGRAFDKHLPAIASYLLDTDAKLKIAVDAWNIEGRNPEYHRMMKEKLRKEWPVLFEALSSLSTYSKKR